MEIVNSTGSSAIFSSLGALGPGPCGGPPKTIRQRNIILNHSVVGEGGGGGGKTFTFGQKWGRKLKHGDFSGQK